MSFFVSPRSTKGGAVSWVAYRRYILAGSRPDRRETLRFWPKFPKPSAPDSAPRTLNVRCGVPSRRACLIRGFAQGTFFARASPALLERPVRTVRGAPARRGGDSPDPRLFPARPGAWRERGLAALRCPCSRLQVRGSPSVASPFSGPIPAAAHSLLRLGTGPSRPWLGRSPGQQSTGLLSLSGSPTGPLS